MASQLTTTPVAASDLISFLKAHPDCRMRRGIRFPQWWILLVAILAILSGQGSLVDLEQFAKRHRQTLNKLLGTDFGNSPSDSTFRLLLAQLDMAGFESLLRGWMKAQPGVAELDTLVCDGKTLRGSIAKTDSGAAKFIDQESPYSETLGVAIAQKTYATDTSGETQSLCQLLEWVMEQWPGSATIITVRSHGTREGKPQDETRYYVKSLSPGAKALLKAIRQCWSIENSWHWVRDVPLLEDAHRYREDNGVQILAKLRSMAINTLRIDGI